MGRVVDRLRRVPVHRLAELIATATYGTVLVVAAISAISVADVSIGYGMEVIAGVGVATWVAHLFAELLAGQVSRQVPLHRDDVLDAVVDGSPILACTVLPACSLLLGRLDVITDHAARTAAIAIGCAQLLAIVVMAGYLAPVRRTTLWMFVAATLGLGMGVVAVTASLH